MKKISAKLIAMPAPILLCAACTFTLDGNVPPIADHQFYDNVVVSGKVELPKEKINKIMYLAGPHTGVNPFRTVGVNPDLPAGIDEKTISESVKTAESVVKDMEKAGEKAAKKLKKTTKKAKKKSKKNKK